MATADQYAIVITTINHPTRAVIEIARGASKLEAQLILVGDQNSPTDFNQPGAMYLDLAAQRAAGFEYANIAPVRHYARKNIGYLAAMRLGATVIVETDDDNIPMGGFWRPRSPTATARVVDGESWLNVYAYYSDQNIWPRGLPLRFINQPPPAWNDLAVSEIYCPIQQGLANGNPDVDAIYRLVLPLPLHFIEREPLALRGAWCPFNSQNTTFCRAAFPLLYLPYYCSFRMTDIWRSFIAQRIAYLNGWSILFHGATVFQERNEHDLLRDFEQEIPGYLQNEGIRAALEDLDLPGGANAIPTAMRLCYRELVSRQFIGEPELALLEAWLEDLKTLAICE